jgi:hypothetical protein
MSQPLHEGPQLTIPRITSFGNEVDFSTPPDFYLKAAPLIRKVNGVLRAVIIASVFVVAGGCVYLGLFANRYEAYVSDGIRACMPTPMNDQDAMRVQVNGNTK